MRYRNFIFIFWRGTIMMLPGRVLSGAPLAKAAMTWRCLKHVFKNWPQPFKASKLDYPSIMKPSHCACAPMGRLPACHAILNHGKINLTNPSVMAIRSEDFFEYRIW